MMVVIMSTHHHVSMIFHHGTEHHHIDLIDMMVMLMWVCHVNTSSHNDIPSYRYDDMMVINSIYHHIHMYHHGIEQLVIISDILSYRYECGYVEAYGFNNAALIL